jgi:S1-C subfamily serine protease
MRTAILRMLVIAVVTGCPVHRALALEAGAVFKIADPSIVVVLAAGAKRGEGSLGSGVIIAPLEVVTNCHVVNKASRIVIVQGSVERNAKLRYEDSGRDLCQLRLDDAFPQGKVVEVRSADVELEVGQQVFAIGSPRGLEHTLTRGIISALREVVKDTGKYIQTDAAVSPGSSGGGLFDDQGRLIGLTTFIKRDSQGLNFAIPAQWIGELASRNRDRLAGDAVAPATASSAPVKSGGGDRYNGGALRVGDTWHYRVSSGTRVIGTLGIEIEEVAEGRIKERVTYDSAGGFLVKREVDVGFSPRRFQPSVQLPGGYQLVEFAPYAVVGGDTKAGDHWDRVSGEFHVPPLGRRTLASTVTIAGLEKVVVPAGDFEAWRVESLSEATYYNGGALRMQCNFWYAAGQPRAVKFSIKTLSPYIVGPVVESYELERFDRAP